METWKELDSFPDYSFSSLGRIKSFKRGGVKILRTQSDKDGYKLVSLSVSGKPKTYRVHRLIAMVFIGESCLYINHKNGIKSDNRIANLEYVTALENITHAIKTGLTKQRCEDSGMSTITNAQAVEIHSLLSCGVKQSVIAKRFGLSKSIVHSIKSKKTWKREHLGL
jgi:hypothetical protein